jgi:hypothetical protein
MYVPRKEGKEEGRSRKEGGDVIFVLCIISLIKERSPFWPTFERTAHLHYTYYAQHE